MPATGQEQKVGGNNVKYHRKLVLLVSEFPPFAGKSTRRSQLGLSLGGATFYLIDDKAG
jgi:hypothetical protein